MSNVKIDNVEAFESAEGEVRIRISWIGDIGWGEYTLWQQGDIWYADSECLDLKNKNKDFLRKLLDDFIDKVEVVG